MNFIDKALGIHPAALSFRSQRSSVLAANIANIDTPGYQAKDYDFRAVLSSLATSTGHSTQMRATHERHIQPGKSEQFGELMYRSPTKYSSIGNTVESEVEQAQFSDNALRYQTSLQFINGTISGLRLAIKGSR